MELDEIDAVQQACGTPGNGADVCGAVWDRWVDCGTLDGESAAGMVTVCVVVDFKIAAERGCSVAGGVGASGGPVADGGGDYQSASAGLAHSRDSTGPQS